MKRKIIGGLCFLLFLQFGCDFKKTEFNKQIKGRHFLLYTLNEKRILEITDENKGIVSEYIDIMTIGPQNSVEKYIRYENAKKREYDIDGKKETDKLVLKKEQKKYHDLLNLIEEHKSR